MPLSALRTATTAARAAFQTARYDRLPASLPRLIATATASRDNATGTARTAASTHLADAYIVAANFMIKLNDDPLAWALADRALQAAQAGDDPLTPRRLPPRRGHRAAAHRPPHERPRTARPAVHDIEPAATQPRPLSVYGTLLEVAAYTAAVDGNREPPATHRRGPGRRHRLGRDANHRFTAFGPANVTLYQVSIAQVLGDNGTAIEHAKTLRPAAIPTAERRGRFWIDVARAYHQWGKPEPCYRALLAAECTAPAEVHYRPPVHRIAEDLLRANRRNLCPACPLSPAASASQRPDHRPMVALNCRHPTGSNPGFPLLGFFAVGETPDSLERQM